VIRPTGTGHLIAENHRDAWLGRTMAAAFSPGERDLPVPAGGLMERPADLTGGGRTEGV
jgi:hypothetical protein